MKIKGDTIYFRSKVVDFDSERHGDKPNTVRVLEKYEADMVIDLWYDEKLNYIEISDAMDENEKFRRWLTDISRVGEIAGHVLVVFSWKHEEGGDG
jgi:hypothetical protein